MSALIVIVGAVVLIFGFVIWVGAPYLPTMRLQTQTALDLLDLKPGQTMVELGSGDGRVARAAAQRGLNVVGYEVNPLLVVFSRGLNWRYRKQVTIVWGNMWASQWPEEADGMFTFLLDRFMQRLDKKLIQTYSGKTIKLASFAFEVPDRQHDKEKNGIFLYTYNHTRRDKTEVS